MTQLAIGPLLGVFSGIAGATPTVVGLDHTVGVQTGAVCSGSWLRCHSHVHATESGQIKIYAAAQGFGPADLQSAYNIPTTITGTPTIAIIDAYGYPTLEADLATYRSTYGLPPCTTASGCLKIVNQNGTASPLPGAPPANDDWTVETALDVDMASAGCPACKILVVQATDDTGDGLFIANNIPAQLGATVVSNSWGGPEQPGQSLATNEAYFAHPGIAVFVSAGDDGYDDAGQGPDYPATSNNVIAVGGTALTKAANTRGWTETAWTSGGSACSLSIAKPTYQTTTSCQFKATTDIAAVADPNTGVAVYNKGAWTVVGGTSASSPLIAAIFAATGNGGQTSGSFVMQNAAKLNDVTSGQNGNCGNILCNAGVGWDGPTGYGTPNAKALVAGVGPGSGSGSGSGNGNGNGNGTGGGAASDGSSDVVGGCSTGGGAGLAFVLVLGAGLIRRRRS